MSARAARGCEGTISIISRRFGGGAIDPATARSGLGLLLDQAGRGRRASEGTMSFDLRHIFNIEVAAIATIVLCVALIIYVLLSILGITGFPE